MKINKIYEYSNVFSQFDVTEKQLSDMISVLSKYEPHDLSPLIKTLKDDITELKDSNWSKLTKWRIKSILDRYELCDKMINDVKDIQDFIAEVTDEGWDALISYQDSNIVFKSKHKPISKLNSLFSFLYKNHRMAFKLSECVSRHGESHVRVEFKLRTEIDSDDTNSKIQHALSEDDD